MKYFDVTGFENRDYTTLSGGEMQRVHFARVLAQIWYPAPNQYRYLFLDEPLTFLDVHYQHQFMQHIKELLKMKDLVVLGVVHDLNLAAKYADQITLLNEGQVFATGKATDVLSATNLKSIFGTVPDIISHKGTPYIFF
jgi:iron complex transport system ATP-binding protein